MLCFEFNLYSYTKDAVTEQRFLTEEEELQQSTDTGVTTSGGDGGDGGDGDGGDCGDGDDGGGGDVDCPASAAVVDTSAAAAAGATLLTSEGGARWPEVELNNFNPAEP